MEYIEIAPIDGVEAYAIKGILMLVIILMVFLVIIFTD